MSSGFWQAVCLMEVSSISRCVIILLKGTFNFWIFSAKVSVLLDQLLPGLLSLLGASHNVALSFHPATDSISHSCDKEIIK